MNTSAKAMPAGIETVVIPRSTDLGDGFTVRRALPSAQRRMVGPFVFFDQMGPVVLRGGHGLDVRPHPHIGLATVTYLFDGEILHRDSLGSVQPIRAGELNWMTAGRGIVHSERTPAEARAAGGRLFGIQAWVALPQAHEEDEPAFAHHPRSALPLLGDDGAEARLISGSLGGVRAPAVVHGDMFYADVVLKPGGRFRLPVEHVERAAYVVEGRIAVGAPNGSVFATEQLVVFAPGAEIVVSAEGGAARLMVFGGEPMDGPRHLWWNFVSSSTERIEQAKADWQTGRFAQVPGESEFIPLPPSPPRPVDYP
ncbi:pirin family protein [Nocardioides sp.]|uniref:pirin family protein n=1 Tax=Nocardioides sp. TaxID=35761 RepID=UPI0031FE8ABD|nr:putative pirin [Nocardioides sp.]